MSENTQELQQVEISIEQAKASMKRRDTLIRLEKNGDFKKLIMEGFCKDHAIRQVMLKATPGRTEEQLAEMDKQIVAIGHFHQYLLNIITMGNQAEQALADDEATREAILAEGLK